MEFGIIFQDGDLVVINKPPGLVVHPAAGHAQGTLVHGLLAACPDLAGVGGEARPGIVHRLDKDTSGVMIAAKTDRAHRILSAMFKSGEMKKTYLAICRGGPPADEGEIDAPIGRHPVRRKEMSTRSRSGRTALTRYRVRQRFGSGASFLEVRIMTGRTHQIRVHLASIGCPVLGDPVYGRGTGTVRGVESLKDLITRQLLHSHHLAFNHPLDGRPLEFEAPLPADMEAVLGALKSSKLT